ncbi:MAG: hypothetical protein RIB45_15280 [Marivibrio sp.]|uniref:hypothetical protein n=1 Tax=Marivibrio sp. TaxID=2039719 RepID=UPI0032EDFBC1
MTAVNSALIHPIAPSFLAHSSLCARATRWFGVSHGRLDWGDEGEGAAILARGHASIADPARGFPLLFVGADSPAAQVFGEDWASGQSGDSGIPDNDAEALCTQAYFDVAANGDRPALHYCKVPFRTFGGSEILLTYHRLLLPFETKTGSRLIVCVSDLLSFDS